MADGPEAGLEAIDRIDGLDGYLHLHTARAEPAARLGRDDESRAAYERALELGPNEAERRFIESRLTSGIAATASISSSAPGTASAETSTSVLRRTRLAEELHPHRVDLRAVVDVEQVVHDLDHVVEAAARGLQAELHVPEDLPRLLGDVALADELPVGVERHDPGDEEQPARLDGVGVVAERLGHPLDAELLAMVAHASER